MKKQWMLPLTAVLGGAAAFVLRLIQQHTGFEAETGLPIPGNPAGTALAGLLAGYPSYVPAPLVIKAVMGLLAGVLYRGIGRKWNGLGLLVCAAAGEIPMIIGYWLYDGFWMKSLTGAAAGIPSNLVQAAFGIVVSVALAAALRRNHDVRRLFPNL